MTGRNLFTDAAAAEAAGAADDKRESAGRNLASYDATIIPDLAGCSRFECVVGLYEHEAAEHDFATWPPAIQVQIQRHLAQWRARNGAARIVAMTFAVVDRACIMVVHHRGK